MSVFMVALIVGGGGLALMALPAVRRHGRKGRAHAPHAHRAGAHAPRSQTASRVVGALHYVPEPRVVFSLLALFGAAGHLLIHAFHATAWLAAAAAAAIAALLEWGVVDRIWRLALGFSGAPSSPLCFLMEERAQAVTRFRNGRGIVRVVRDGRAIQLFAELPRDHRDAEVRVGDALRIEEVDAERERVLVLPLSS